MQFVEKRNVWRQGRHSIRRAFTWNQRKPKDSFTVKQFQLQTFPWEDGELDNGGGIGLNINTWIADICIDIVRLPSPAPSIISSSSFSIMTADQKQSSVSSVPNSLEKTMSVKTMLTNWTENPQREWHKIVDSCFSGWDQGSPLLTGILQHRPSRFIEGFTEDQCKPQLRHWFDRSDFKRQQQRRLRQHHKAKASASHKLIRLF